MEVPFRVGPLEWDRWNEDHIAVHHVTRQEVHEVVDGDFVALASYKGRSVLIGCSGTGRILAVVLGPRTRSARSVLLLQCATRFPEGTALVSRAVWRKWGMTDGQPVALPPSRVPEFNSVEEEAEWWDTHDITDYLDELRPIKLEVAPGTESVFRVTVRLRMADWEALERMAGERTLEPESLAAEWLTERVRQEDRVPAGSAS